jgi:hypothetical protein
MTWTRRRFLATTAAGAADLGWPRVGRAQSKAITLAHSVSTFV